MRSFIWIFLSLGCIKAIAQTNCRFDEHHAHRLATDTQYKRAVQDFESFVRKNMLTTSNSSNRTNSVAAVSKKIPIAVHVMTSGGAPGDPGIPNNAQIKAAITYVNQIFKGTAPNMEPPSAQGAKGDMFLEFILATQTPLGSSTSGIDYINASCIPKYTGEGIADNCTLGCSELALKSLASWNPKNYLNIYVVTMINGGISSACGGVADGFASVALPGFPSSDLDGVVVTASSLLSRPVALAHELGHALGLYHTFEAGETGCPTDTDCQNQGDMVCDTDPVTKSTIARTGNNNCNNMLYTLNTEGNVMGYTPIKALFTNGQFDRVSAAMDYTSIKGYFLSTNHALELPKSNLYFNKCANADFTTNDFACISVGKSDNVWAGTFRQGLYKFDGTVWARETQLANYSINDIKYDILGGIWVAQSGSGSVLTKNGGVELFQDANFTYKHYNHLNGLPGTNVKSLFIDNTRSIANLPVIWSANQWYEYYSLYYDGGVCRGVSTLNNNANTFTNISGSGISLDGNGSAQYIAGNATEIWVFAPSNYGNWNQIVRYNAVTNALIGFHEGISVPELTGFVAKALYFDANDNKWVGKASGGVAIKDKSNKWYSINFPNIFPAGSYVNSNAISGDALGNVFIGTSTGLVIYSGGPLELECSYKRYTTDNALLSNNVKGICWDKSRQKLLLATENGIEFWSPVGSAAGTNSSPFVTSGSGELNNPATWCGGEAPPPNTDIIVKHPITITSNITLNSIRCEGGGNVTVATGVNCTVVQTH